MKWTEIEINKIIELIKKGKTYNEISEQIGRSHKSVKEKLRKLGFTYETFKISLQINTECLNCNSIFMSLKRHNRKFCNNSCSATFNNQNKIKKTNLILTPLNLRTKTKENYTIICIYCENIFHNKGANYKYCSHKCHINHKKQIVKEKIESGDETLHHKQYKYYLINKYGEKCMKCGWCEINTFSNKIPIELEHIDGNSENNKLDNLKLLCPNCHSLTPTYKALNFGKGRHSRKQRYKDGKSF